MARSVGCRFFLTPEETVEVIDTAVGVSKVEVLVQLERPGLVLAPVRDRRDMLGSSEMRPPRLILTHQQLSPGPDVGSFDGFGVLGLILVSMPSVEGDRFYLGSAGAKFVDEHDPDAVMARAMVRDIKRRTPGRLLARAVQSGMTGPAKGVGCSEEALRLARGQGLQLRQLGVENIEYVPAPTHEASP